MIGANLSPHDTIHSPSSDGFPLAVFPEQLMHVSRRSEGQLISTLQDIRAGRDTEIDSLNLAIAQIAAALDPRLELPRVRLLGELIVAKATQRRRQER